MGPIGLDIGAQTPAEIGVAKLLQRLLKRKNRKKRTYGYSKEIMRALTAQNRIQKEDNETIVTRHVRTTGTGTKMLI